MHVDLAGPRDDPELRRLLRENPMDGRVRVTLEREPDFFLASTVEGDLHQTVAVRARPGGRVVGIGSRAVALCYVNGSASPVGYLSQLRVDQDQPGRLRPIREGYRKIKELHGDGACPFYITTIIEDNRPARRFLEAGLEGLPTYNPLDTLVTLVIPVARSRAGPGAGMVAGPGAGPGETTAVGGSPEMAEDLAECLRRYGRRHQFARVWEADDLTSPQRTRGLRLEDFFLHVEAGRVVGSLALWDQTSFKQTVVRGYSPWLSRFRPWVNAVAPLLRQPKLPPPGSELRIAFGSHLAADDDDPDIVLSLLKSVCTEASLRGITHLVVSFAQRHPLLDPVREALPHREYRSVLYQVFWEEDRLSLPTLDGCPSHVEMATF